MFRVIIGKMELMLTAITEPTQMEINLTITALKEITTPTLVKLEPLILTEINLINNH